MSGTRAGAIKGWQTRRRRATPKQSKPGFQRSRGALDYDKQVRHDNLHRLQEQEKRLVTLIHERGTKSEVTPHLKKDLAQVRRDITWTKKSIAEFG